MKERPILFSGDMVRAILAGRKTQTRRVVKVQPPADNYQLCTVVSSTFRRNEGKHHWCLLDGVNIVDSKESYFHSPYKIGDTLWVRETWARNCDDDGYLYRADCNHNPIACETEADMFERDRYLGELWAKWSPSIHMPRKASRINLKVTNIRLERLLAISESDARAEGVSEHVCDCYLRAGS